MTLLLLLTSCILPEKGIDNTRVVGSLRIEATSVDESSEQANNLIQSPLDMEPLHFGYRVFNGALLTSGLDETTNEHTGDADHWRVVSPVERSGDNSLAIDITLSDPAATARVRVYNLDETSGLLNEPTLVHEEDFTFWTLATFEAQTDVNYSVGIYGLEGPDAVTYSAFMLGQHPDDANVLVGAYKQGGKATERGSLLAGTNAQSWSEVGELAFEAPYEMLLVREFVTDESGKVESLDENVKQAYIWAGTWANLAQNLPAGTWYSKDPVALDLTKKGKPEEMGSGLIEDTGGGTESDAEPFIRDTPTYPTVKVDSAVVIDKIADATIGQVWDEPTTEPNDTDVQDAFANPGGAFDLGTLSGPGFVDVIENGSLTDNGYNYWTGDNDTFKFQVPEPTRLNFTLSWADSAQDFDVLLVDVDGNILDQGYYGFPEIPEINTEVLMPGVDYYIAALLWIGTGVDGDPVPYELTLEQLPE